MKNRSNIFIGCSHHDEGLLNLIVSNLHAAEHRPELVVWDDRRLDGDAGRHDEIEVALDSADIGILLLSPHFLSSDFIKDHDVQSLLKRKQREGLLLHPVLLSACAWEAIDWLAGLDVKPLNARALGGFDDARRKILAAGLAAEIVYLLEDERDTKTQIEKLRAEAESLGKRLGVDQRTARSILAIVGQRHVKRVDLRERLNDVTKQYLATQAQFSGLSSEDPTVSRWLEQAKSAFTAGDFDKVEGLLTQTEHRDLCAASHAATSTDHHRFDAAACQALLGETSLIRLRHAEAAEHFSKAAALVPNECPKIKAGYLAKQGAALISASRDFDALPALECSISLEPDQTWPRISLGLLYQRTGKQAAARTAFEDALKVAREAQQAREAAVIYMYLGDIDLDRNDLDAALDAYEKCYRIRIQLAGERADDDDIQQEMSEILEKIGDAYKKRGEIDGAYSAYVASLSISRKIIERNQRKLEGYCRIAKRLRNVGDINVDRGDLEDALADYRESLRIMTEEVIEKERRKHHWHRELTVCHNKIGDVLRALGDLDGALNEYQAGLDVRGQIVDEGPGNATWQGDLLASSNKIGSARIAKGDLSGALEAYRESRKIALRLANRDPGHAGWQSDLSITYEKIGDVSMDLADHEGAFEAYKAADRIRQDLANKDPGNADWQRGLVVSRAKLADLAEAQRKLDAALGNWQAALAIASGLERSGRLAPHDAWMVGDLQGRVDALLIAPAAGAGG